MSYITLGCGRDCGIAGATQEVTMLNLHVIGHVLAIAVIAVLVQQLMQARSQTCTLSQQDTTLQAAIDDDMMTDKTEVQGHVLGMDRSANVSPSSVWCMGSDGSICRFRNLCYNHVVGEFVMFINNESVFENVQSKAGAIVVELSSVKGHNAQHISIVSLPFHAMGSFAIQWINRTSLLFNRFKPDNLMHVLHDDILPLHQTLKTITMASYTRHSAPFDVQLVFTDGWELATDFRGIYEIFSRHKIIFKESLVVETGLTCFSDIYLGVSRTTVWYDYGFTRPQGPVLSTETSARHIHSTVQYIADNLKGTTQFWMPDSDYIILLTREDNRKILNAMELIFEITTQIGIKVINLNFDSYSFNQLVHFVQKSKGLIGMHGSLLCLAIFLAPGSMLVELFPYAVNPDNYTPYKTLAGLPGMGLLYRSWVNTDRQRTVGHPEWEHRLGGIDHLPADKRDAILSQAEVPPHLCCSDPSWLYHIYQDTVVDIPTIISLVNSSLSQLENKEELKKSYSGFRIVKFHPSKVKNVTCIVSRLESSNYRLSISWTKPWTVYFINHSDIQFEILVQLGDKSTVQYHQSDSTEYTIETEWDGEHYVWVRCVIDGNIPGPYSDGLLCNDQDHA